MCLFFLIKHAYIYIYIYVRIQVHTHTCMHLYIYIYIYIYILWTPSYGRTKAGRPARTYIQQLCEDTGGSPEDLPEAMNVREEWRKRERDIRVGGTTWWWWYIYIYIHIYIYIYIYILDDHTIYRKWTRRHEFKSWPRLIAFHIAQIPLGKVWIQWFSLQLWVNSRAD